MRRKLFYTVLFYSNLAMSEEYQISATPIGEGAIWGGDMTIISREDLDREQVVFASDILKETSGFVLSGTGDNGRQKRFSMRGAIGGENQILIDGIPVNNPAASGGGFDFADLLVDDMESIEVDPGLPGVIDGSDAIGGTVHLRTRRGSGANKNIIKLEGGSFKTGKAFASTAGEYDNLNYAINGIAFKSGRGKFRNKVHGNVQSDDYKNLTLSSAVGYALTPDKEIEGTIRFSEAELDFDDLKFSPEFNTFLPVRSQNESDKRQYICSLKYEGEHEDGLFKPLLQISNSSTRIKNHMTNSRSRLFGNTSLLKSVNPVRWNEFHKTSIGGELGLESVEDTYAGNHDRGHYALFVQHEANLWEGGEALGGLRYNQYESVGHMVNYKLGLGHSFGKSRIRSSIGTGFKAPIITDQFTSSKWAISNPGLKPEKSITGDIGIDQKLFDDRVLLSITGFLNRIDQVFTTARSPDFKFQRINGGQRRAYGIEQKLSIRFSDYLELRGTLTGTQAQDHGSLGHRRSPHIPKWVSNAKVIIKPIENLSIFVSNTYTSAQINAVPRQRLSGYNIINVGAGYKIGSHVEITLRAENLGDKRYEETLGYGVRGRAFYIGTKVEF